MHINWILNVLQHIDIYYNGIRILVVNIDPVPAQYICKSRPQIFAIFIFELWLIVYTIYQKFTDQKKMLLFGRLVKKIDQINRKDADCSGNYFLFTSFFVRLKFLRHGRYWCVWPSCIHKTKEIFAILSPTLISRVDRNWTFFSNRHGPLTKVAYMSN